MSIVVNSEMVSKKPDSKKAKNVMVSISLENWQFARHQKDPTSEVAH